MRESDLFEVIRAEFGMPLDASPHGFVSLVRGVESFDDCAVLRTDGSGYLVVGTDFIRGAEFYLYQLGVISDADLGRFLVAANLSDVAAMGAQPRYLTTNIRYPPGYSRKQFENLIGGIRDATENAQCTIIGGDIGGFSSLVLTATALGTTASPPLLRSSARPGDRIFYVGPRGVAGAAVLYFRNRDRLPQRLPAAIEDELANSWRFPAPQTEVGLALGAAGLRIACQDNSDGLKATLQQIGQSSGVSALVDKERWTNDPPVALVAEAFDIDPFALAFSGSTDFGLVFTLPPSIDVSEVLDHATVAPVPIGTIADPDETLNSPNWIRAEDLPGITWDHQETSIDSQLLNREATA